MKTLWIIVCLVASCLAWGSAHALPTLQVTNGILTGATGIEVTVNNVTTLYDVTFQGGTCAGLFSGCDSSNDFVFKTEGEALAASQALLDQVFLDGAFGAFDSAPDTTAGCSDFVLCMVLTPYDFGLTVGGLADVGFAQNLFGPLDDVSGLLIVSPSDDLTSESFIYAVWSRVPTNNVPEAPSPALVGAGMMAYAVFRRRSSSQRNRAR